MSANSSLIAARQPCGRCGTTDWGLRVTIRGEDRCDVCSPVRVVPTPLLKRLWKHAAGGYLIPRWLVWVAIPGATIQFVRGVYLTVRWLS